MPGNWRVLSVSGKRGSPACSKVTSHSGVTLRLFVLAGELHEDVLMPVRLKCLHNTICPGFLPVNVQTNWEPLFRAQMLPITKLIKNLNYNDRLSTGIFPPEVNRKAVQLRLLLRLTKLFLRQPQARAWRHSATSYTIRVIKTGLLTSTHEMSAHERERRPPLVPIRVVGLFGEAPSAVRTQAPAGMKLNPDAGSLATPALPRPMLHDWLP